MSIAIIGATGAVGTALLEELRREGVPGSALTLLASERSAGKTLGYGEQHLPVAAFEPARTEGIDLAFFAAGAAVSRRGVPELRGKGTFIVDNSSAFRADPAVPLVVPEVNGHLLDADPPPPVVANPNCSSAQMVCVLGPLQAAFGLAEVYVTTYQSVSGTGRRALRALERENAALSRRIAAGEAAADTGDLAAARDLESPYKSPIAGNVIPQIGDLDAAGWAEEERKLRDETRRILDRPDLPVFASTARVPTRRGHGEHLLVRLGSAVDLEAVRECLHAAAGVIVEDGYTTPRAAEGRREVFVGRLRGSPDDPRVLQCWIVADNLLKGAAWNAVQIADRMGRLPRA